MIHAGGFTALILALLDGMIDLDSDCLNGGRGSNVTINLPGGEQCPETLHYQYCQCYSATMNKAHRIIQAARDKSISFANTEDLQDFDLVVYLSKRVLYTPKEISANIRHCKGPRNPCLSLYEEKKDRYNNYKDAYKQIKAYLYMARSYQQTVYYKMPVVITVLFTSGMIGNITLLYIFCKHREARSGPRILLINLAVGHILLLVFNVIVKYYFSLFPFTLGERECRAYTFLTITPALANILSVMVLSITRYYKTARLCPGMGVVLVWTAAAMEALKPSQESVVTKYDFSDKTHCDVRTTPTTAILMLTVSCFLPFVIIGFFTVATCCRGRAENTSGDSEADKVQERNVKILPVLAVVFAITYPPFYIFWLLASFHKFSLSNTYVWFFYFSDLLINITPALYPVVLYVSSRMFQRYFHKTLSCGCKKRKEEQEDISRSSSVETISCE